MTQERTIEGTVAQFEAWLAASEEGQDLDPAAAAGALADLFVRAERGGADMHDPTAELVLWLARDLARDESAGQDAYEAGISVLPHYMLFLRRHRLWRRSENAVQRCWEAISIASQSPLGLTTLGETFDTVVADRRQRQHAPDEVLAVGLDRGYVAPLQATLDTLANRGSLTHAEVAALIGVPEDSIALEVWVGGLARIDLLRIEKDERLTPSPEVSAAGGCPPASADLIISLVRSLVRAMLLRLISADAVEGLQAMPRGTTALALLAASTEPSLFLAEDEDEDEEGTEEMALDYTASMVDDGDQRAETLGRQVVEGLRALEGFGVLEESVLPRGSIALVAPEPFHQALMQAVSDVTGVVGTDDQRVEWEPVELPFAMAADAGIDVVITLEHDPQVWRRFRILGSATLEFLHLIVQSALGWRDTRPYAFTTTEGEYRFAPRWLLGQLRDAEHAAVVDADAVRIGSVLTGPGDELVYLYGHLSNPWRVRVRVERVMSGMKESIAWLDGGGQAPHEPTRIGEEIAARLPAGMTVPAELEAAWQLMESKRWAMVTDDGVALVAPGPPDARPAVVFTSGAYLEPRIGADSPAMERLAPVAVAPGGTMLALWLDDDGATQAVRVGPEGDASLIGSPVDLLRLAAVGYEDISTQTLGQPPQNPQAVAGVAEFRDWVRGSLGVDVPEFWGPVIQDHVTAWVDARRSTA